MLSKKELEDNHPDKIVKPIEKWSVGSYVVFCKNDTGKNVLLNKPYEIIKKRLNSTDINIIDEAGNSNSTNYTSPFYIIKWFPTLAEAEAFSKSLLEPKPLTVDDLVAGEVYKVTCSKDEWESLFYCKTPPRFTVRLYISDKYTGKKYDPGDWGFTEGNYYKTATPEEKQWLNVCIAEDKFIEKDYALRGYDMYGKPLKSEVIPEYVELLKGWSQDEEFVGEIFDTKQDFQEQFKKFKGIGHSWNWNFILTESNHKKYFKESTKAAYDAQFKKEMKEDYQNILDIGVGDIVKCVSENNISKFGGYNGAGWRADLEFVVTNVDKYSEYNVYFGGACDGRVYSDAVRLVKKKSVEKPFEFNKWYKSNNADGLFFIQSKNTGYGFRSNHVNYWFTNNKDFEWNIDGLIPALDSEVKERLLTFAIEKYPVGTKFISTGGMGKCEVTSDCIYTIETWDVCIYKGDNIRGRLFNNSFPKWAETISTPEVSDQSFKETKQESSPIKKEVKRVELISFDEEDIVLSTNNKVSISNKQLIIND